MPDQYTPEQYDAITSIGTSVAVTAGAGAGKTKVLVARYLELITQGGAEVDQIVAITFTNKAANEMLERIHQAVAEMIARAKDEGELQRAIDLRERLARATVATIHSFCTRLLREHPVEAGLDPRFAVMEEIDAQRLLQESVQETLLWALDNDLAGMGELLEDLSYRRLQEIVRTLYQQVRNKGIGLQQLHDLTMQSIGAARGELGVKAAALARAVDELAAMDRKACKAKGTLEALAVLDEHLTEIRAFLADHGPDCYHTYLQACALLGRICKSLAAKPFKEYKSEMMEPALAELELICHELGGAPLLVTFFVLTQELDRRFRAAKASRQSLDFGDLEEHTLALLRGQPQLLAQLQERYRFLMIDEFQDTNHAQEALVRLLAGDELAKRVFIVGDPKQSIYRFRGAEVALFERVKQSLIELGGNACDKSLSRNFRTREPIIGFVNALFAELMTKHNYRYDALTAHRASRHPNEGLVEMLLAPTEKKTKSEEAVEQEADLIARRIRAMVDAGETLICASPAKGAPEEPRPVHYGDVAILFRAMTRVKVFEEALRRYHIPYYVVDGRGFFQKQEVTDLLTALRAVNNGNNLVALFGYLRSPMVAIQDQTALSLVKRAGSLKRGWSDRASWDGLPEPERAKLEQARANLIRWRQLRSRLSVAELMEQMISDSEWDDLLACLDDGPQQMANLRKFIQIARQAGGSDLYSLDDFLSYIDELRAIQEKETEAALNSEGGDAVKLLTIHKSKGLEYGVVVVAETGLGFRHDTGCIRWHPEVGIGLRLNNGDPDHRQATRLTEAIDARNREEERGENIRLLYVAATRARDYLILSGCTHQISQADSEGWSGEAKSWLDWLGPAMGLTANELPKHCSLGSLIRVVTELAAPDLSGQGPAEQRDLVLPALAPTVGRVDDPRLEQLRRQIAPAPLGPRAHSKLGVTPLLIYAYCPRSYYYGYRLHLRDTGWGLELDKGEQAEDLDGERLNNPTRSTASDPLLLGSIVHHVCEYLHQPEQLDELLDVAIKQAGLGSGEQGSELKEQALPLLKTYTQSKLFTEAAQAQQSIAELPFLVELDNGFCLEGIMDRVLFNPDGSLTVIDFKTNQVRDGVARVAKRYQLQLQLYALAIARLFGRPVREAVLYFLRADQRVSCPIDAESLKRAAETAAAMVTQIEAGRSMADFPVHHSHCFLCGYRTLCPDASRTRRFGSRTRIAVSR